MYNKNFKYQMGPRKQLLFWKRMVQFKLPWIFIHQIAYNRDIKKKKTFETKKQIYNWFLMLKKLNLYT